MTLSRKQLSILAMWFLRGHMSNYAWVEDWNRGLRRKGKINGNCSTGRWRTVRSLGKLGLLTVPDGAMDGDVWDRIKPTEAGLKVLFETPRIEVGVYLEDNSRNRLREVWPKEVSP